MDGQRPSAGPLVRSLDALAQRLNTTDTAMLARYHDLAHGVAHSGKPTTAFADDALKQRAFGRAPPTRHTRNAVSRQIQEKYSPGDCWFLDLGPTHVPDMQGNRFSRLGVDWATGFAVLTLSSTAGSSSLVDQLDAVTSLSRQRAGRSPCMFRMDFGGRGGRPGAR